VTLFRVALVGTGMIGGSLALALKGAGAVERVVGFDLRREAAERARAIGIVDEAATTAAEAVRDADVVVLAVPVGATEAAIRAMAPGLGDDALVTDVGSVKAPVLAAATATLPRPSRFVGAHPLAGTERSGPEAASAMLFDGKRCLVVPHAGSEPTRVEACAALWRTAGARVSIVDAETHDRAMAWVSHLPHAVAFALAAAVGEVADAEGLGGLHGGGFVDTTRIAASDPTMWRDVFRENRAAVLAALDGYERALATLRAAIDRGDGDALVTAVERARAGRAAVLSGRDLPVPPRPAEPDHPPTTARAPREGRPGGRDR
jgi:prephenate dehydrogenase